MIAATKHMRAFGALLVVVVLVGLAGCGGKSGDPAAGGGASGRIKLGFVVKQPEEPWFQMEWKFAEEAATKLGFDLIKIGAPNGERALAAVDTLAAAHAAGFVICSPDVRLGPAIMMRAERLKMRVITVDDRFLGADGMPLPTVVYVGISARAIGGMVGDALMAEMKARKWTADDTGLCAVTFEELDTARERVGGAVDACVKAGLPEARVFRAPEKTADIPGSLDAVAAALTRSPTVKHWLVCGTNDNAVLGAVRAMEGRGFGAADVVGIGINGTDCIGEFEKPAGTGFWASVLLTPRAHGYATSEALFKWVKDGVAPPLETFTTGVLITRANFRATLKEQGITQ